jgi:hypothetical protein
MDKFRYIETYLKETSQITDRIDVNIIMKMIDILLEIKKNGGRLFFFRGWRRSR